MKRSTIIDTIVSLTMFLFMYAAASKLMEFGEFRAQLSRSPMTTDIASYLSLFVPGVEIIATVLLAIKQTKLIGLYLSLCIMYAFSAYIAIMLIYSPYLPCSCGGILNHLEWHHHLIFNGIVVAMDALAIILYVTDAHTSELDFAPKPIQLS